RTCAQHAGAVQQIDAGGAGTREKDYSGHRSETAVLNRRLEMIDAALVGLGWWGKNILHAVQGRSDKLRFVHAVSKEISDARPLADQHGLKLSSELDAVLDDARVKAVVLATPHSLHADQ